MGPHDDVLEEVAERSVDGALVLLVDFDVVGNGPEVRHRVAGLGEDDAGAVAVFGAGGVELLQ